jgi:hypothetical protein
MNKTTILIIALAMFCFFPSCTDKATKALQGWWSIDTLYYQEYDTKICLYSNAINFKNEQVVLPITEDRCEGLSVYEKKGKWDIQKTDSIPLLINIKTANEIFYGTHQLLFFKDKKNKLLKIKVISKDLYLIARKGLFNYNKNIKLIDELINQSQSNK